MSNLPYHRPPEWELYRNESVASQKFRKAVADAHAHADSTRSTGGTGLAWPEQRWVNQVVPSDTVNPDDFDTFNYRYQVYARPPPVQCEPQSLAEVTDEKPAIQYNVKRIAMDKPCTQAPRECDAHWTQKPWILTDTPPLDYGNSHGGRTRGDCTQNNNTQDENNNQWESEEDSVRYTYDQDTFVDVDETGSCDVAWGSTTISTVDALESLPVDVELLRCCTNNNACKPRGACQGSNESMQACPPSPTCEKDINIALNVARCKNTHPNIGYGTYQIVASKQYNVPPEAFFPRDAPLPPALDEYREFSRRCPNPNLGRYDRTDPLMEMCLPANRTAVNMPSSRTPFNFLRNPRHGKLPPLFKKLPQPSLEWSLPNFIAQ